MVDYIIYTDGGCRYNPGGPGGIGAVIINAETGKIKEINRGYANTTNNRMEIMAVIAALSEIEKGKNIDIYSDSQYVVNTAKGLYNVKQNDDLWDNLFLLLMDRNVDFRWIKGHDGNKYNERCDALATIAMDGNKLFSDEGFKGIKKKNTGTMGINISVPEEINIPQYVYKGELNCRKYIENINKKLHLTFRDLAQLKTGGIDGVSMMSFQTLTKLFPQSVLITINMYFTSNADIVTVLRWYYRGLNLDKAIRKRLVDKEIMSNTVRKRY